VSAKNYKPDDRVPAAKPLNWEGSGISPARPEHVDCERRCIADPAEVGLIKGGANDEQTELSSS
jgi:hypothetical protein